MKWITLAFLVPRQSLSTLSKSSHPPCSLSGSSPRTTSPVRVQMKRLQWVVSHLLFCTCAPCSVFGDVHNHWLWCANVSGEDSSMGERWLLTDESVHEGDLQLSWQYRLHEEGLANQHCNPMSHWHSIHLRWVCVQPSSFPLSCKCVCIFDAAQKVSLADLVGMNHQKAHPFLFYDIMP